MKLSKRRISFTFNLPFLLSNALASWRLLFDWLVDFLLDGKDIKSVVFCVCYIFGNIWFRVLFLFGLKNVCNIYTKLNFHNCNRTRVLKEVAYKYRKCIWQLKCLRKTCSSWYILLHFSTNFVTNIKAHFGLSSSPLFVNFEVIYF